MAAVTYGPARREDCSGSRRSGPRRGEFASCTPDRSQTGRGPRTGLPRLKFLRCSGRVWALSRRSRSSTASSDTSVFAVLRLINRSSKIITNSSMSFPKNMPIMQLFFCSVDVWQQGDVWPQLVRSFVCHKGMAYPHP